MRTSVRETVREIGFLITFFRAVPPVPPLMTATFGFLTMTGVVMLCVDPRRVERAVVPLVLLQIFASSCGFAGPARRGYYDVLLTHGAGRLVVAVVQWVVAVASGVASWLVLGAAELLALGDGRILTAGTGAAMFLASVLPWALTAALPRFAGAVGWLLAGSMAVPTMLLPGQGWPSPGIWTSWPLSALASLLFPVSLVGRHLDESLLREAVPALGLAAGAMGVALLWVVRADFRLETGQ